MTVTLRTATAEDTAALVRLWQACELTRPWNHPVADLDRALDWQGSTVLVAVDADTVVGSVMAGYDGHRGWLYYLAVDPARRGEGLARGLVEAACGFLADLGCPKAELMVRGGNPAAGLYPHLGWERQDVEVWATWLSNGTSAPAEAQ
jgi:ribosomal protein S18 acetylase RimI-like enzyme